MGYVPMTHHQAMARPLTLDDAYDTPPRPIPKMVADPSGALKADGEKARVELIPTEAIEEIAAAFTFGAKKYSPNNWRKGFSWIRVTGSLLRHVYAWLRGEDRDPESGLSHLAHAGANVCFLLTFERTKTGTDDRYRENAA